MRWFLADWLIHVATKPVAAYSWKGRGDCLGSAPVTVYMITGLKSGPEALPL